MIHTYRDSEFRRTRFFHSPLFLLLVVVLIVGIASRQYTLADAGKVAGVGALVLALVTVRGRRHRCSEIRLSDDGICEFETGHRVIRLHVSEIRSVQYRDDSDSASESDENYTISYRGGKLRVTKRMTGFGDFLTRLKTLNPAVDLNSFPTDGWPSLRGPATETDANRIIRGALFPLIVIALLVFLAIETLAGK